MSFTIIMPGEAAVGIGRITYGRESVAAIPAVGFRSVYVVCLNEILIPYIRIFHEPPEIAQRFDAVRIGFGTAAGRGGGFLKLNYLTVGGTVRIGDIRPGVVDPVGAQARDLGRKSAGSADGPLIGFLICDIRITGGIPAKTISRRVGTSQNGNIAFGKSRGVCDM